MRPGPPTLRSEGRRGPEVRQRLVRARRTRRSHIQSLVEFALNLPGFMVFFATTMDFT